MTRRPPSPSTPPSLLAEAALAATVDAFQRDWRYTRFYRRLLDGPATRGFVCGPRDDRPADLEAAHELLAGRLKLAGETLELGEQGDPWDRPSPSRRFAVALHRFDWLPGLIGVGEAGVREALRLTLG